MPRKSWPEKKLISRLAGEKTHKPVGQEKKTHNQLAGKKIIAYSLAEAPINGWPLNACNAFYTKYHQIIIFEHRKWLTMKNSSHKGIGTTHDSMNK